MVTDTCNQLARVGPLDEVITGTDVERLGFHIRIVLGGQYDDGNVFGILICTEPMCDFEAIHFWHAHVYQYDSCRSFFGEIDSHRWLVRKMKRMRPKSL